MRLFICRKNILIGPHYAHSCMHMKIRQLTKHPWQFICFVDLSGRYGSNTAQLQPSLGKHAFLVSIIQPFEYYQNLIIDMLGLWKSHRLVFVLQCITWKAHVLFMHTQPHPDTSPFSEPRVSVFCLLAVIPLCVLLLSSGIHYPFMQCKFG